MSNDLTRLDEIVASLEALYGNLEQPHYGLTEKRLTMLRRHPFLKSLFQSFFVHDETDLNNHMALHLRVRGDEGDCEVCLSLAVPWAMLIRVTPDQMYSHVIASSNDCSTKMEREILALLERYKFKVLRRAEAASPIPMKLFDADSNETIVYHALISDDSVVPQFLFD